jgi:hypothetical protein
MEEKNTLPLFIAIMGFLAYSLGLSEVSGIGKIVVVITIILSIALYLNLNPKYLFSR